jgi:hypothetical protein
MKAKTKDGKTIENEQFNKVTQNTAIETLTVSRLVKTKTPIL